MGVAVGSPSVVPRVEGQLLLERGVAELGPLQEPQSELVDVEGMKPDELTQTVVR